MTQRDAAIETLIAARSKSVGGAFALALIFGPLGSLYGSVLGGVILIGITLVLGMASPVLALIVWPVAIILAPFWAASYNKGVRAEAALRATD